MTSFCTHLTPSLQSTVRRRKGKPENDTSELKNSTHQVTKDTLKETHDTQEPQLDQHSPEAIKKREKIQKIREVLSTKPLDLNTLKELAITSGGLMEGTKMTISGGAAGILVLLCEGLSSLPSPLTWIWVYC